MFASLPVEVRLLIFEHLFSSSFISINGSIDHGILVQQWDLPWQILSTSKKIHSEAITKIKIRLLLSFPAKHHEAWLRSYARDISYHLSSHLRLAVTILTLEGGVTGAYLQPLELFPNIQILRLRSSIQHNRRATESALLPRVTFRDLLFAHAETGYRETPVTNIGRDMLQDLVLQHNPGLGNPHGIRIFFWHTTKFHIDHGETFIEPMIEFLYDSGTDSVRGVHVRRTRLSSSMAECSTSDQVACIICEFRSRMGVPAIASLKN